MATVTFSSLPAEIHISIAKYCHHTDLLNLCLVSKGLNERCLHVLYRLVDLRLDQYGLGFMLSQEYNRLLDARTRQQQFVKTILSHPEYGRYVRSFKATLCRASIDNCHTLGEDMISDDDLWRAMHWLTHVRNINVGTRNVFAYRMIVPEKQFSPNLFQSATSVRLMGHMQYDLAKTILSAINPAMLKHLCLDMVQDHKIVKFQREYVPGDKGEDGRVIALGAISGLLAPLTGHCTALQTLILRREGQSREGDGWHADAEEASYLEWGSFIRSVRGTVQQLTFEQAGELLRDLNGLRFTDETRPFRIMDDRFRRFVLPAIVGGNWPHLALLDVRGVRGSKGRGAKARLTAELRTALGKNPKITVKDEARFWRPYRWT